MGFKLNPFVLSVMKRQSAQLCEDGLAYMHNGGIIGVVGHAIEP